MCGMTKFLSAEKKKTLLVFDSVHGYLSYLGFEYQARMTFVKTVGGFSILESIIQHPRSVFTHNVWRDVIKYCLIQFYYVILFTSVSSEFLKQHLLIHSHYTLASGLKSNTMFIFASPSLFRFQSTLWKSHTESGSQLVVFEQFLSVNNWFLISACIEDGGQGLSCKYK